MKLEELYNTKAETKDNITYSIDMIRLKTYISYSKFTEIEFRFKTIWKDFLKKTYGSSQIQNFFYNYVVEIEEGTSFWFGFLHNSEKRSFNVYTKNGRINEQTYNLTVEFNPNKVKKHYILDYLLSISGDWVVKSYDLALDLKVSIVDLIWDISGRHIERIDNRGFDNKTVYLGKGDGRIKIYNKKNENDLEITGSLTRVEISREIEDFEVRKIKIWKYDNNFPNIYLNQYVYSMGDYEDKTLLAILYAVQNGLPLRELTRYYRKKIKTLLEGGYKIKFDNEMATKVFKQIILYYFVPLDNIKWW